jgi:pimeloyl-ACP methyl ester carboxylesterase
VRRLALLACFGLVAACSASSSSSSTTTAASSTSASTPTSAATTTTSTTVPSGDAFYIPPSPLPAGQPGDIIRTRSFAGPAGSTGHLVLYLSQTVDRQPVAVSGVVYTPGAAAPAPPPEGRTVLTWAHGTTGMGDACAPSKTYVAGTAVELFIAQEALGRGWVYAATDYQGLGPPGDHPYVVGLSEGRNVLDSVRAAEHLRESRATARSKVLVWGHSQGGGAAAWAAELAPTYAPELSVVGAVAGAPAAQLSELGSALAASPYFGFALMVPIGMHAAYPSLRYEDILTPKGVAAVGPISTECSDTILRDYAGKPVSEYVKADPNTKPGWKQALAANDPGQRKTPVPIFIYQGDSDEIIPVRVSKELLDRYCALGDTVARKTYPGATHVSVIPAALGDIVAWAEARLAGTPAPTSCAH